jgi:hypothetical protein
MTDRDPEYEHIRQLVGWTVSHAVRINHGDDDAGIYEPFYGLVLTHPDNKKHQLFVTIQCDHEGNGPGWLAIEKEKYGT